jgi:hypothetical protein
MTHPFDDLSLDAQPWPPGYYVLMLPNGVRIADSEAEDSPKAVADLVAEQRGMEVVPFTDPVFLEATKRVLDLGFPQIEDPLWPCTFQMQHCKGRLVVMKEVSVPISVSFRGEA